MRTDLFDYDLPPHLIAQHPSPERDRSRLLVVRRADATLSHHTFSDLPDLLAPGDLLVLNDTRVLPARLVGRRARTGGKWEGLFLRQTADGCWELLCQTRGRLAEGEIIDIEPVPQCSPLAPRAEKSSRGARRLHLQLRLVGRLEGHWLARPLPPAGEGPSAVELLEHHGHPPLPPYIRKGRGAAEDHERYQTVYARRAGAVAAPTAGLHFTPSLFERLRQRGIDRTFVTLHVGLGTFQPIQVADVTQHRMHREWGELSEDAAAAIAACRQRGGRLVAVGTTSVRVLETVAATGPLRPWSGETQLYIYPPYEFRAVDALITNFHLPRSSLLLLVSAFAAVDLIRTAYRTAVEQDYRFYSYGDAMLIV
jgi:S-adenosylmethionine:tRNA ribosyltransferase-isomerase